ncbi:MAG: hypothetical protein HRU31_18850 [Rhodobacteraceae bacterium]|nr:hypothetical protein [Paracoccaceae bacterium]
MATKVNATAQEKGILKSLCKSRVKTWIKNGVSEERMRMYMADKRWQYIMSQRVFSFQAKNF